MRIDDVPGQFGQEFRVDEAVGEGVEDEVADILADCTVTNEAPVDQYRVRASAGYDEIGRLLVG